MHAGLGLVEELLDDASVGVAEGEDGAAGGEVVEEFAGVDPLFSRIVPG
jgi:hypothetical protein